MDKNKTKSKMAGGSEIAPDKPLKDGNGNTLKSEGNCKIINIYINFGSANNVGAGGAGDPGDKAAGGAGDSGDTRKTDDPGNKGAGGSGEDGKTDSKNLNIFINFESSSNIGGSGGPGTKADGSGE